MEEPKETEKKETLEEWYSRIYDYDPDMEEVDAKYGENFKKWEEEFINRK